MRYNLGVSAIVRVWLRDGASHEDVGYGKLENSKSKADGLDKVSFRGVETLCECYAGVEDAAV